MKIRRTMLALLMVSSLTAPAFAQVFDLEISNAPPRQRYEAVPAARPGYVWAPGYWGWEEGRYQWIAGYWMQERPGYVWAHDRWIRHGHRWAYTRGHWENDPHWDHNRDWHANRDWDHDDRNDHHGDYNWINERHHRP